jgi:uncharacterized protein YndB with AHSA1/START domain
MQKTGQLEIQLIGDNEVLLTRLFSASVQDVFDAHTKPNLVKRWMLGPPGWSMLVCEIDLRVGGGYRVEWSHPEQGNFAIHGEYLEIDAPVKFRNTETMGNDTTVQVITFTAQGGKTLMSFKTTYASSEARAAAIASGGADGMEPGYANLDRMLAELN